MKNKIITLGITFLLTIISTKQIHAITADQLYLKAYTSTMNALSSKDQKSINNARKDINKLKNTKASWAIGEFSSQVDKVQNDILIKIVNSIIKVESNLTQTNINTSRKTIHPDLPTVWKNSYSSALDSFQQILINRLYSLYNTANETKAKSYIERGLNVSKDLSLSTNPDISTLGNNFIQKFNELLKVSKNIVVFKDKNLEKIIRNRINKPANDIYIEDVKKITYLCCSSENIKDISGVENLVNLTQLSLPNNKINDITPLQNLFSLNELYLDKNVIQDINALSNLTNLSSLNLNYNLISDLSPLSKLTKLNTLNLNGTFLKSKLSDITPFKNLTSLKVLTLRENQINNIDSLCNLSKLEKLDLMNNKVKNIHSLKNLTNLTYLHLSGNQIEDISALKNLIKLDELYLGFNKIKDISPLKGLVNLTTLYLSCNPIKDSDLKELENILPYI